MLTVITICLIPLTSFACDFGPKTPEPTILSKYCFIKSQLPPSLKISITEDSSFQILNSSLDPLKLFLNNQLKMDLPISLKPTHLPVYVMKKGSDHYNNSTGFYPKNIRTGYDSVETPLVLTGKIEKVDSTFIEKIVRSLQFWKQVDKSEEATDENSVVKITDNFYEIPFKYYVGNQFVDNRLKIHTRPISEFFKPAVYIVKIEARLPLPQGLTMTFDGKRFQALHENFYSHFKINYNGTETITFVKEFTKELSDFDIIKMSHFPFYIGKENTCFALSGKSNTGPETRDCEYDVFHFKGVFNIRKNDSYNGVAPSVIDLPNDEIVVMDLLYKNKLRKINFLKHYYVNEEWIPIESVTQGGCQDIFTHNKKPRENKINYLKDTVVNYPKYQFKESDLICIVKRDSYYASED